MAKDFVISIPEDKIGQWLPFNVPSSSTGFPCFEVGQLGGSIKCSYSPDGKNAKPLLLNGIVPEGVTLYCMANAPATAILNDFFFRNKIIVLGSGGGGGGGGGGTTYSFDSPLNESGGVVSLNISSNFTLTGNELQLANEVKTVSFVASDNGANYGAVDIRTQDGYLSISEDGGTAGIVPLASFGFEGGGDNLRILNKAGGVTTFNSPIQYEGTVDLTNDNTLPNLSTIKQQFARLTEENTFTGDNIFNGKTTVSERLQFSTQNMSFAPDSDRSGDIYLSNGAIGNNCYANINLENRSRIVACPDPTADRHVTPKIYVDNQNTTTLQNAKDYTDSKVKILPAGTTPTTSDLAQGQIGFVLRS